MSMKFGLKAHHTDLDYLYDMCPEAIEFAIFADDLEGSWVNDVKFEGPIVVHMPEKFKDGTLLDPSSPDETIRSKTVELLKETIDLSERLNARSIIFHPGGIRKSPLNVAAGPMLDSMRELRDYAPDDIELLLENMPGIYWYNGDLFNSCLFKGREEITAILKELNMGLCLDLCHAKLYCNGAGMDLSSYLEALKPFTRHIHVSDARGFSDEGMQIGTGDIDFPGILPLLAGLSVIAVPEIKNGHRDSGAGFRVAVRRLRNIGFY